MEIEIPDLDDVKFYEDCWACQGEIGEGLPPCYRCKGKLPRLTQVGKHLVDFLGKCGVGLDTSKFKE